MFESTLKRMKKIINLTKILDGGSIPRKEVAVKLCPTVANPYLALNRLERGEGQLNASQLVTLAELYKVGIEDLFEDPTGWKAQTKKRGVHTYSNGDYTAELDSSAWTVKVSIKGTPIYEDVLLQPKALTVSEFLNFLDKLIEDHK